MNDRSVLIMLWHLIRKVIRMDQRLAKTVTSEELKQAVAELKKAMGAGVNLSDEMADVKDDIRLLKQIAPKKGDTQPKE